MEQSVVVKSYPNGLNLLLKKDIPMEELLREIANKFDTSRQFFGKLQVAISFDGRELTDEEQMELVRVIQEHSDLHVICIVGKNEKLQKLYDDSIRSYEKTLKADLSVNLPKAAKSCNARLISSIKSGETLESPHTLIILGDVDPGAVVSSQKDVIVLGSVFGEISAGEDMNPGHFILALDLQAERLRISGIRYRRKNPARGIFRASSRRQPEIAVVREDAVVLLPVTKEVLGNEVTH